MQGAGGSTGAAPTIAPWPTWTPAPALVGDAPDFQSRAIARYCRSGACRLIQVNANFHGWSLLASPLLKRWRPKGVQSHDYGKRNDGHEPPRRGGYFANVLSVVSGGSWVDFGRRGDSGNFRLVRRCPAGANSVESSGAGTGGSTRRRRCSSVSLNSSTAFLSAASRLGAWTKPRNCTRTRISVARHLRTRGGGVRRFIGSNGEDNRAVTGHVTYNRRRLFHQAQSFRVGLGWGAKRKGSS